MMYISRVVRFTCQVRSIYRQENRIVTPPIHPKNLESILEQRVTIQCDSVDVYFSQVMEQPVTAVKRQVAPALQTPVISTAPNKQQEKHCSPRKIETTIEHTRQRF